MISRPMFLESPPSCFCQAEYESTAAGGIPGPKSPEPRVRPSRAGLSSVGKISAETKCTIRFVGSRTPVRVIMRKPPNVPRLWKDRACSRQNRTSPTVTWRSRWSPPVFVTLTRRSASRYGSGRRKTARNALNMVVLAPIPSATESTAAARKPGVFAKMRTAYRTSRKAPSNISTIIISTSSTAVIQPQREARSRAETSSDITAQRGLARRPLGREARQSSRSINRPSDRKRRGIVLARLLVSCPLPCEHREDDVIDPLALEPEAPDHVSFLAETQPLHESDRASVARVHGSGDAMLSKFAEQVADNGSYRFCGVLAALESPRHGNSDFRLSLCRAVCAELAGATVPLREILRARNRRRRELRGVLRDRQAAVDTLL